MLLQGRAMTKANGEASTHYTEAEALLAKERREVLARAYQIILSPTFGEKPKKSECNEGNESDDNKN